jgi:hypothetical protein
MLVPEVIVLGEKLGEYRGRVTSKRLLEWDGQTPKVEKTFEGEGTLLGKRTTLLCTYWEKPTEKGVVYGEGQLLITTEDGEMVLHRGYGTAKVTPTGATEYGCFGLFPWATDGLKQLLRYAIVNEYKVDDDGGTTLEIWEWK